MTTQNATPATFENEPKNLPSEVTGFGWIGQEMQAASVFNIAEQEGYHLSPLAIQHQYSAQFSYNKTHPHEKCAVYVMLRHKNGQAWIFGLKPSYGDSVEMLAFLHMYSPKTCTFFAEATDAQSVAWDKRVQKLRAKGVKC